MTRKRRMIMSPLNLSGPHFLRLYITLFTAAGIAALIVRELIRRAAASTRWSATPPALDPFQMAYLAGGETRALQAAIVALVQKGSVKFRSPGDVRSTGEPPQDSSPLETAVHAAIEAD